MDNGFQLLDGQFANLIHCEMLVALYLNFRGFRVILFASLWWITVISVFLHLHQNMVGINRLWIMTWEHDRHKPSKSHWYFDGIRLGIVSFSLFSSELWINHITSCLQPALCCNSLNQMGNLNAWPLGKLGLIPCEEPSIPKIVVGMAQQHSKLSTKYWLYLM